jgi:putative oxidoreductase
VAAPVTGYTNRTDDKLEASMFRRLMATRGGIEMTVLRLAPGVMISAHALQKVFGVWHGAGLAGIMGFFTGVLHMPVWLGYLVIATECLAGPGLILGIFTRVAAFALFCEMIGAVYLVHFSNGFFMNWEATMPAGSEGFEFHVLVLAILIAVMIKGGGAASVDRAVAGT